MQELSRNRTLSDAGRLPGMRVTSGQRRSNLTGVNITLGHEALGRVNAESLTLPEDGGSRQGRASEFAPQAAGPEYAEAILNIMNTSPGWTVLDIEGASGAQSIPLARRVRSVKAVGFSRDMVDLVTQSCLENGVVNLSPQLVPRDMIREAHDLGNYDVVVASGAALSENLPWSVVRMNKAARKKVLVSTAVGDGPFDRRVYESTGRKLDMGPSFTSIYYDVLHKHLGILADIAFVKEAKPNGWQSREEALEAQKWMFRDLTAQEEERLRHFLDEHLVRADGMWKLPYERDCKWAIMWWEKEEKRVRRKEARKTRMARQIAGAGKEEPRN